MHDVFVTNVGYATLLTGMTQVDNDVHLVIGSGMSPAISIFHDITIAQLTADYFVTAPPPGLFD